MRPGKTFWIFAALLALFLLPPVIFGENAYIDNHDNLDSEVMYRVVLAKSGEGLNFSRDCAIPQIMNGIPRACLPSGFNSTVWPFFIFKPIVAYTINYLFLHIFAFVGMYLLLRRHFFSSENDEMAASAASFCFAVLPFLSIYGLSVAGQPLLLYAFLNVLKGLKKLSDALIILLFPFFYSFPHAGPFIITFLFLVLLIDLITQKKLNIRYLLYLAAFSALSLAVEFDLLRLMLFTPGFASQRSAWTGTGYGLAETLRNSLRIFFEGEGTAPSMHTAFILPASIIALIYGYFTKKNMKWLLTFLAVAAAISIWYGLINCRAAAILLGRFELYRVFQWNRFYWISPTVWYLVFACTLAIFIRQKWLKYLAIILIILQTNLLITNSDTQAQMESSIKAMKGQPIKLLTYKRFYSQALFDKIAKFIGSPKKDYRVVSIGLHPAVALYNGFYTLDSYQNDYPLSYKVKFRRIIAKELDKSKRWREYFDGWGDRCYIFCSELDGMYVRKERHLKLRNLQLNTRALKEMGGKYILSAVEILNYGQNRLEYVMKFEDNDSPWEIYLYRVR